MQVKRQRRDTSQGTCPRGPAPKSVNPSLGCREHKLSGLKRTDLVECGCKGKDVFLGWDGMLLFHLIRSYTVWSSNCLVKFPCHPLPPDPKISSISHLCPPFPCSLIPAPITLLGKLRYSRDEVGGWREEEILPQCSKRRSLVLSPHPQLCSVRKPTHIPLPQLLTCSVLATESRLSAL